MFSDRGAAAAFADATVDAAWLDDAAVVHVPYYAIAAAHGSGAARSLLADARARGMIVSMDPSSAVLADDRFARLVREVEPDIVFCNADEADALGLDEHGLPGARLVVVKRGARPVLLRGTVYDVGSRAVGEPGRRLDRRGRRVRGRVPARDRAWRRSGRRGRGRSRGRGARARRARRRRLGGGGGNRRDRRRQRRGARRARRRTRGRRAGVDDLLAVRSARTGQRGRARPQRRGGARRWRGSGDHRGARRHAAASASNPPSTNAS